MKIKSTNLKLNWRTPISLLKIITMFSFLVFLGCHKEDSDDSILDTELCLVEIDGDFKDVELDEAPEYLNGGSVGFVQDLFSEIKYPTEARQNDIEGICLLDFQITENGTVEQIEIIENPGGGIGESAAEILEMVTAGVSFSPGILNEMPVKVQKQLRLTYELE